MVAFAFAAAAVAVAAAASSVVALAPNEPESGVILGAWLYTADDPSLPDIGYDRPSKFNQRLGLNAGAFQFEQNIPLKKNPYTAAHEDMVANTTYLDDGTDASIFITVYAEETTSAGSGLDLVTDAELNKLAAQMVDLYNKTGRGIFIRFCPEMNGNWFLYGQKPDQFKATWIRFANIMRANAPGVALVWSPNFDLGDGQSYAPYYPGDQYVDWVGLSAYWKGSKSAVQNTNTAPPANIFAEFTDGVAPEGGATNFYQTYAAAKNKPFVLSEGGSAFITCQGPDDTLANCVTAAAGDGQLGINKAFWGSVLSDDFLSAHPLFKMFQIFEHKKFETYNGGSGMVFRDFRVSVDATTRDWFKSRVQTLADAGKIILGNVPVKTTSSAKGATSTGASQTVSTTGTTSSKSGAVRGAASAVGVPALVFAAVAVFLAL
ncbi:glycoside hydrolase superfamily [Zopfochytrium polystomum]|nr:glycoside hydrolase superfamily [Zopfochytrium polystomum]